jgi:putative tryptophan/tyrosine transport system substrate-binding protein
VKTSIRQEATGNSTNAKVFGFALCGLVVALYSSAHAQQPTKIPRIGILGGTGFDSPNIAALRRGLRDLGYIEGKNIRIEYRDSDGKNERFPSLVAELVQLKVDMLVSGVEPAIRAAKQATKTIPIVMVITVDPVATGLVDSLARPGGNITGLTRLTRDLGGKRLELLTEAVPGIMRVGVLWSTSTGEVSITVPIYEAAARALKISLQSLQVRGPDPDLTGAFQSAVKRRANAIIAIQNSLLTRHATRIVDLAIKHRLPTMFEAIDFVEAGGLMSYSTRDADTYRRAAIYVDKIIKGAKPADLPVEQPIKFEFVINLKTAKQIGLTIPPNVLARADRVIR